MIHYLFDTIKYSCVQMFSEIVPLKTFKNICTGVYFQQRSSIYQELMQTMFDISILILGMQIWACQNLILSKTETTINPNSSCLIKQQHKIIMKNKCNVQLGFLNGSIEPSFCCNLATQSASIFSFCIDPCICLFILGVDNFCFTNLP